MEILDLKNEIAKEYIKKFKNELGWFKSLAILPIESKIKNIIASDQDVGDKFVDIENLGAWKDIINFISPSTAEKIYAFVKEKKEILAIKNTKEELEALKDEIVTWKKKTEDNNPTDNNKPTDDGQAQNKNEKPNTNNVSEKNTETKKVENTARNSTRDAVGVWAVWISTSKWAEKW